MRKKNTSLKCSELRKQTQSKAIFLLLNYVYESLNIDPKKAATHITESRTVKICLHYKDGKSKPGSC